MAQVLVRDLAPDVVERLKARPRTNRRSVEDELGAIIHDAARQQDVPSHDEVQRARAMFAGLSFTDSAALLRDDRDQ